MNYKLFVQNIKCNGCGNTIEKELSKLSSLEGIKVNPEEGSVEFNSKTSGIKEEVLKKLDQLGYPEGDSSMMHSLKSYISCAKGRVTSIK